MSDDPPVLLSREGAIAVLTLNNPLRLNAVSEAMRRALFDALIALGADETCRAIVLTGAEGNFTAAAISRKCVRGRSSRAACG